MTPALTSFAIVFSLLAADGLCGDVAIASADPAGRAVPVIDVSAPQSTGTHEAAHVGGQASRVEVDDADLNNGLSAWYRLAYVGGGTRLQVFEHYAATTTDPQSDIVQSENAAWQFANTVLAADSNSTAFDQLPTWAYIHTGNDTGSSAGLIFTLTYLDLLTPGALVGDLRVAGTGSIGPDGVVIPVSNVEVKVAAAVLARPDVVFTPSRSELVENSTIIDSQHTRIPDLGSTVGEWLNVSGYEQAGREAASHPGTIAFVVVHDVRQALAWLCGRTHNAITCAVAQSSVGIPIGTP
jgi:hypothetical protein